MLQAILLASSMFFCATAQQGADMDDADFGAFIQAHNDFVVTHGESAAKGCLSGAIGGAPSGFAALCLGCATGATANVVQDVFFPEKKD